MRVWRPAVSQPPVYDKTPANNVRVEFSNQTSVDSFMTKLIMSMINFSQFRNLKSLIVYWTDSAGFDS